MPYPVSHVLFFLLCVGEVAVYALAIPLFYRKLSSSDIKKVLLLLFVGCLSSLLPDFIVTYNLSSQILSA